MIGSLGLENAMKVINGEDHPCKSTAGHQEVTVTKNQRSNRSPDGEELLLHPDFITPER